MSEKIGISTGKGFHVCDASAVRQEGQIVVVDTFNCVKITKPGLYICDVDYSGTTYRSLIYVLGPNDVTYGTHNHTIGSTSREVGVMANGDGYIRSYSDSGFDDNAIIGCAFVDLERGGSIQL